MIEYFGRKDFLTYFSKEMIEILKKHETTGTLIDGKNLFLLNTGGASYKIVIERQGKQK